MIRISLGYLQIISITITSNLNSLKSLVWGRPTSGFNGRRGVGRRRRAAVHHRFGGTGWFGRLHHGSHHVDATCIGQKAHAFMGGNKLIIIIYSYIKIWILNWRVIQLICRMPILSVPKVWTTSILRPSWTYSTISYTVSCQTKWKRG